ncbi:hypothetical protein EBZ37_13020, partial [bacterium]|nr:hypothetical protein [bacterium]
NVERLPQLKHQSHELDDERSSPNQDPSPETGYHFELITFRPQATIGQGSALHKMNPFARDGVIQGNHQMAVDERYYREQFSYQDLLVPFLQSRQARYLYGGFDLRHGPALVNSDYEFKGISDREFGFCWGFSSVNRYFGYAAFFDPDLKAPISYLPNGKEKNERWFRYYESIIDDILTGKPRIIPGFRDFAELSSVPEIEFYLKLKTTEAWASRAISFGSLGTFFSSTDELDEGEIDQLLRGLRMRLNRGELPKILFTSADSKKRFGGSLDVHSVIANGVKLNPDGTGRIEIWDINFYFSDLIQSPKFLEIRFNAATGKRELHYPQWHEIKDTPEATDRSSLLGKVRISPENDSEMGALIRNLKGFCGNPVTRHYCR